MILNTVSTYTENCRSSPLVKTDKAKPNTQALDTNNYQEACICSASTVFSVKGLPSILKIRSWEIKLYLTYYKIPFPNETTN